MKVDGITLLQMIRDEKIKDGTKFKASRDNVEIPFLEKNRVLHIDGHGLYNELGEAPTIDLILNYEFEIIKGDKSIEKIKEMPKENFDKANLSVGWDMLKAYYNSEQESKDKEVK